MSKPSPKQRKRNARNSRPRRLLVRRHRRARRHHHRARRHHHSEREARADRWRGTGPNAEAAHALVLALAPEGGAAVIEIETAAAKMHVEEAGVEAVEGTTDDAAGVDAVGVAADGAEVDAAGAAGNEAAARSKAMVTANAADAEVPEKMGRISHGLIHIEGSLPLPVQPGKRSH